MCRLWPSQAFRLQSLKEATTEEGFLAALEALISTPDADKAAVVQAALKCKREHKVCAGREGVGSRRGCKRRRERRIFLCLCIFMTDGGVGMCFCASGGVDEGCSGEAE